MAEANQQERFLRVQEVAEWWNVSARHIYRLIERGDLPAVLIGGVCPSAVDEAEAKTDEPAAWVEPDDLAALGEQDAALQEARTEVEDREDKGGRGLGAFRVRFSDAERYLAEHAFRPVKVALASKKYIGLAQINAEARALRAKAEAESKGGKKKGKRRGR